MATIDLTPQVLDIKCYGGDTVPVTVTFPPGYVAGRVWKAQIRATPLATAVDASFQIILGANADAPVTLLLTSVVSRQLVTAVALRQQEQAKKVAVGPYTAGDPLASYKGVWDCQLAPAAGGDPTNTLVRGSLEITLDVTRTP